MAGLYDGAGVTVITDGGPSLRLLCASRLLLIRLLLVNGR